MTSKKYIFASSLYLVFLFTFQVRAFQPLERGKVTVFANGLKLQNLQSVRFLGNELGDGGGVVPEGDFIPCDTQKIDGLHAIPYPEFIHSRGFKADFDFDSLFGLRLKIYISDEYRHEQDSGIAYASALSPLTSKRLSLYSFPRNKWIDVSLWFPLVRKGKDWDIFMEIMGLESPFKYDGVFFHELGFLTMDYGKTEADAAVLYGLETNASWLGSYFVRGLLFLFLFFCLFLPLLRLPYRIRWRVLSIFILPFFLGLFFLLMQMRDYFTRMVEAELYGMESRMKAAVQELLTSSDGFDAAVSREIEALKSILRDYIDRNLIGRDLTVFHQELEDVLIEEALARHLRIIIDNGHQTYYSQRAGNLLNLGTLTRLLQGIMRKNILPEERLDTESRRRAWEPVMETFRLMSESLEDDKIMEHYLNNPNRLFDFDIRQEVMAGAKGTSFWSYFVGKGERPAFWYVNGSVSSDGAARYLMQILQPVLQENPLFPGMDIFIDGFRMAPSFPDLNRNRFNFAYFGAYGKLSTSHFFAPFVEDGRVVFYYGGLFPVLREYSLVLRMDGQEIFTKIRSYKNMACLFLFLVVFCFGLVSFVFARQITGTFLALERGLEKIENGDLSENLVVRGRDQLAEITGLFNRMLIGLREKSRIAPFLSTLAKSSIDNYELYSVREQAVILFYGIKNLPDFSLTEQPLLFERFLSGAQACVYDCGGQIDKFTGSAVLAVFRGDDRAERALDCALRLRQDSVAGGFPGVIRFGVGIAGGPVVLGNVGSSVRKDYTAIGNTVNVAARLENLPADKDFSIFFDEQIYGLLSEKEREKYGFRCHEEISLKGKAELLTVYEIL